MNDTDMDEALAGFYVEAGELMVEMEALLLRLEDAPDDPEELNALFRTVHTVKGTAGLFGLNDVVTFTHAVETLMDKLRDGELQVRPAISSMLLACKDQIQSLLGCAERGEALTVAVQETSRGLMAQLLAAQSAPQSATQPATNSGASAQQQAAAVPVAAAAVAAPAQSVHRWEIQAAFGAGTFREGTDPFHILDYLRQLGTVSGLQTSVFPDADFESMDPEVCRIGFELLLQTAAPREQIEAAFGFVVDSCVLSLKNLGPVAPSMPDGAQVAAPGGVSGKALDAPVPPAASQQPTDSPGSPASAAAALSSAPAAARGGAAALRSEESRVVRVPAEKLDQLINLVGELVIAGSGTCSLARKHRLKDLLTSTSQLSGLIEEIRDRALSLRMVAVGETFSRFRRVVRDLSSKLGKQVDLELVGTDAELDKSMLEGLNDPLVHIVRNALDHGIEMPEERVAAGKSPTARLVLAAQHEAGGVVIRVSDDGSGLNRDRILAKAIERGLVSPTAQLSDEEVHHLIFAPGFSTADAVTDLSGRGVGMDVVRRAIEALRGTVQLRSVRGQGTTVEMRLPLTLAIIDGFHVRVGSHQFVLPMDTVVECINTRQMTPPQAGQVSGHLSLRGSALPVLHLRELFELDGPSSERQSIVVVRCGNQQLGLVTDTLMGEGQTVIKPMGELFQRLEGIAGSTVLGTGEVALILDVHALLALVMRSEPRAETAATPPTAADAAAGVAPPPAPQPTTVNTVEGLAA